MIRCLRYCCYNLEELPDVIDPVKLTVNVAQRMWKLMQGWEIGFTLGVGVRRRTAVLNLAYLLTGALHEGKQFRTAERREKGGSACNWCRRT